MLRNCKKANHIISKCEECDSERILFDPKKCIIFCADCGLILQDWSNVGSSYFFNISGAYRKM